MAARTQDEPRNQGIDPTMTRTTLFRTSSSRRPLPSLLASAIAGSLLVAAAMPALAQSHDAQLDHYQQLRSVQAAAASVPSANVARSTATALASAAEAAPVMGAAGNRESWQTEEFQVDWGLAAMNADAAYARGLTGQGIRLGVFDSGTGLAHDEFAGKNHSSIRIADLLPDGTSCSNVNALWGPDACFASDGDVVALEAIGFDYGLTEEDIAFLIGAGAPYGLTFNTHGTHVSGTIAANRDGSGMHGVAFGADLAAAKLFFDSYVEWYLGSDNYYRQGSVFPQVGPSEDAFASMYSQMNAQGVRAINHSWGLGSEPETVEEFDEIYNHEGDRAYLDIFAEGSRQAGMIQVWAAGNSADYNPSPEEAPLAGVYATLPRAFADIEPYWLAVVNLDQDLQLSDLSHRCGLAANWCLAAPGSDIISTSYGSEGLEGQLATDDNQNVLLDVLERVPSYTYEQMSGTSMAAPHVTGALGLLFERFPYLDNAQVRDVLLTTATDLGAEGVDDVYGWGLVNLEKAIEGYGQLRVDTNVVMNTAAGGLKVWEGDAWDDWTNDIGGPGALTKSGSGWLRLSGDNSFNGAVLREGILELDGVNTLTEDIQALLPELERLDSLLPQLTALMPQMISTMKTMKTMLLTQYATQKGMQDQQTAGSENATAMGEAFDASMNDDSFYLPPEIFDNEDFKRGMKNFISPDGKSVRFIVSHEGDPLTPEGIERIDAIKTAAKEAVKGTPLEGSRIYLAGSAATFKDMSDGANYDLIIAGIAAMALIFIIMLIITRAVVAAAVIVATVAISLGASLGLSVLIWQHLIGIELHWMVLPMSLIILLAVGADYNLLLVARFKEEIHAGLHTGIIRSMGGTGSVVTSAGLVFAFTMMSMAVSDLTVIGQVGTTIGLGLLFDTLVVRSLMMPSIAALLGKWFWWPQIVRPRPLPSKWPTPPPREPEPAPAG
ncbi:MAG: MMPL family transporter [Stenotrophomonas sp.]|nr:MMPL family transporter [Stenotrophomonas sp.]